MKNDDSVSNCMKMEVYRNIGEAIARIVKYGEVEMTALEMQQAIDIAKYYPQILLLHFCSHLFSLCNVFFV